MNTQNNKSNKTLIIVIVTIGLWLIGVWFLNSILHDTNSYYPMLDRNTLNPNYSPSFNEKIRFAVYLWTFICVIIGILGIKYDSIVTSTKEEKEIIIKEKQQNYIDSLGKIAISKYKNEAEEISNSLNKQITIESFVRFDVDDYFVVMPSWDGLEEACPIAKQIIEDIYSRNPGRKVTCWWIPSDEELLTFPTVLSAKTKDEAWGIIDILYYYMDIIAFIVPTRVDGWLYYEIVVKPEHYSKEIKPKFEKNIEKWGKEIGSVMINYMKKQF